jgi:xanthine dehydrogenase accessory factor
MIAEIDGVAIRSPFEGILRGLIHPDVEIVQNMKIGDVDPRIDSSLIKFVSDKALAIGGGVIEALLTPPAIRKKLWKLDESD